MADAPDLGSGARKGVGVRLSPLAPPFPSHEERDPDDDERERSWLEVIGGGNLREADNEVVASIQSGGRARISDIVLFYQLKSELVAEP
jgi:hypothetical protein